MSNPDFPIQPLDLRASSDREYAALSAFSNRIRAERLQDDPPIPLDENVAGWRHTPAFMYVQVWAAWSEDEAQIVGSGRMSFSLTEENRHVVDFGIDVLPGFRQRGFARQLLALIVDDATSKERRLMLAGTNDRVAAGAAFMQRLGARPGLAMHTNQLVLAELHNDLLQQWIERAQEFAAADFDLVFREGACPEAELAAVAALIDVMNTAPRGDLEVEDFRITSDRLREWQKADLAKGNVRWTMITRERVTGTYAGFTDVVWNPNRPYLLHQGGTGVLPEYRNRGLGRWLKAAMLDKILRERPQVKFVRTGNADSNAPMLKINHALGFKPYLAECVWQVETEKVKEYLSSANLRE